MRPDHGSRGPREECGTSSSRWRSASSAAWRRGHRGSHCGRSPVARLLAGGQHRQETARSRGLGSDGETRVLTARQARLCGWLWRNLRHGHVDSRGVVISPRSPGDRARSSRSQLHIAWRGGLLEQTPARRGSPDRVQRPALYSPNRREPIVRGTRGDLIRTRARTSRVRAGIVPLGASDGEDPEGGHVIFTWDPYAPDHRRRRGHDPFS